MLNSTLWPLTAAISAGHLTLGGCDTAALAAEFGTPLYVLDAATIRAACRTYQDAFAAAYAGPVSVHYACKALLNTAVARLIAAEGLGLDVVSGGELFVALRAGVPGAQIHLHGNAKPRAELEQALAAGVGHIMVDTLDELQLLAQLTAARAQPQPIMLRVSPEVSTDTHAHIQTGQAASKFGLPLAMLDITVATALAAPGLRLDGLHCHLGSQIFDELPYRAALAVLLDRTARVRDQHGVTLTAISPGGGLGVPYLEGQAAPDVAQFAQTLGQALTEGCAARNLPPLHLIVEPGRSIVARAGVGLYSVLSSKPLPGAVTRYLHLDGGMADNIRPALYGARYTALLANRAAEAPAETVHLAGRYCESGDVLLRDAPLPAAEIGDLVAFAAAGAYTLAMASNYNLTPRPAVLLVEDGVARVAQRRETYADLVARDY